MPSPPLIHSGHDFDHLLDRWETVIARHGWEKTTLIEVNGDPVLAISNSGPGERATYLSAGIHGDECAPVWGLLQWAENATDAELARPLVLFPCLNPHGLRGNTRRDRGGRDLNRSFGCDSCELIEAWKRFLGKRRFDWALNLHEDYDTTGIYLYELACERSVGRLLLDSCEDLIPHEPEPEVDGREFDRGLLSAGREQVETMLRDDLDDEWPEAIYLFVRHGAHSLTFETPSEMDLGRRTRTQRRFVETAMKLSREGG